MPRPKSPVNTDPEEFLSTFWASQETQGTVFLSVKDSKWTDHPLQLPVNHKEIFGVIGFDPENLYFTPCVFTGDRRLRQNAKGKAHWLFADLDEVDPRTLDPRPQIAWESSPGRYQCAWHLDTPLGPRAFERLNKAMTYYTGADKGGWSWTKVLRVPGSISTKYDEPWTVRLLWADWEGTVDTEALRTLAKPSLAPTDPASGPIRLPKATASQIRKEHWTSFSPRTRKLIRAKVVRPGDDRSAKLWDLAKGCAEAGLTTGQAVRVMQDTVWNKYKGQRRELRALWNDATKAYATTTSPKESRVREDQVVRETADGRKLALRGDGKVLPHLTIQKFLSKHYDPPGWLVDRIWSKNAFGFWVGQEKAYKTTTVLDFAVSVATGMPFLNEFEVKRPGRVLYLHNEGKPSEIQGTIHRLMATKGAAPVMSGEGETRSVVSWGASDIEMQMDIHSLMGFDLTDETDRDHLYNYVVTRQPRLIIMESWYLLAGGVDENSAQEVKPIVEWLLRLATELETAVVVSHHFRKGTVLEGVRMSDMVAGSGVFGRSYESRFMIERKGEEDDYMAEFHAQHRYETPTRRTIRFEIDKEADEGYNVHFLTREAENAMRNGHVDMPTGESGPSKNGRAASLEVLDHLVQGEFMPLAEAAGRAEISERAMRLRVKRFEGQYKMALAKGKPVIVKVSEK